MKKILLLVLPLFFLLFLAKPSFAQNTTGNPLFDYFVPGAPKTFFNIADSKKEQKFVLMPFSNIVVAKDTFSENNVKIYVFEGDFDKIKEKILPKDQSTIASYYFVFTNNLGKPLTPAVPIRIQTYNNYPKTITFFYPLNKNGKIDTQNQKNQPGPVLFKNDLPVNDSAFVIAVNKILDKNDPIFTAYKNNAPTLLPTTTLQVKTGILTGNKDIIALVGVIILILAVAGVLLFVKKKKPRKIIKVKEPDKLIIGGK